MKKKITFDIKLTVICFPVCHEPTTKKQFNKYIFKLPDNNVVYILDQKYPNFNNQQYYLMKKNLK